MAKTYIEWTSCKAINWQFWEFFNVSINLEKLQQYANEKWYVNMVMSKRKEVGQYWDTHYFTLNEWNPESSNQNTNQNTNQNNNNSNEDISIEDIPF